MATKVTPEKHKNCWITEMSALRSSSLCYTCSGRSNVFFNGTKALITYDSCTQMLGKCSDSIDEIVELILTAQEILEILFELEKYKIQNILNELNIQNSDGVLKTCLEKIKQKDIKKLLNTYSGSSTPQNQKINDASMLCQDFLKLSGKHFLPSIMTLIKVVLIPLFGISDKKFAVNSYLLKNNYISSQNKSEDLIKIENSRVRHEQSFKKYQAQVDQEILQIEARRRSNWKSRQLNLVSIEDPFANPQVQVVNPEVQILKVGSSDRSVAEIGKGQDLKVADFSK